MCHAHAVDFAKNVVGKVEVQIEMKIPAETGLGRHTLQQPSDGPGIGSGKEFTLLALAEATVPEHVRFFGRQHRTVPEPLELVLETELFVRYRPAFRQRASSASKRSRQSLRPAMVAIREIGNVAAEQLIRAFAGKADRHFFPA